MRDGWRAAALRSLGVIGKAALSALALIASLAAPSAQASETPLIMSGKTGLHQRVILRRETPRLPSPGAAQGEGVAPALLPYFVFERRDDGSAAWLRLATRFDGADSFWAPMVDTIEWRQNIVLTFETDGDLRRLMVLATADDVFDLIESEAPDEESRELRDEAERAEAEREASAGPVLALGPRRAVDLRRNFYFLPILDFEQALFESSDGGFAKVLQIAVAQSNGGDDAPRERDRPRRGADDFSDYQAGVVFVIDTTSSMRPYVEAVGDVVLQIYDELAGSDVGDNVQFGVVAFRDALDADAGPDDYVTRTLLPLRDGRSRGRFREAIEEATNEAARTAQFREDSYAGVSEAIAELRRSGVDARWIVLITDAGPRDATDARSQTGLSARGMANSALENESYIAAFHLLTEAGARAGDHARAEDAYRDLSRVPNVGSLYYPIEGGDVAAFARTADRLTRQIVQDMADNAAGGGGGVGGFVRAASGGPEPALDDRIEQVARGMRLRFLGRRAGERAPAVFEGWIADRDFESPALSPVEIRVLLSKNQLNDLTIALEQIQVAAEDSVTDPAGFFRQVRASSGVATRRPDIVAQQSVTLAEASMVDELLDGLPYLSEVMNITEDEWIRKSIAEQTEITDGLREKRQRYERYNASPDRWVVLTDATSDDRDLYFPMLLEDLP